MNSRASVWAISCALAGDSSVTSTSMIAVFGGTLVALILAASSEVVSGNPSLSMTRWSTAPLVNNGMYEFIRPATTSSFWYAVAVVDPSIDTITCVDDANLAGNRRIHVNPTANSTAVTSTNVTQYRRTAARSSLRFNLLPSTIASATPTADGSASGGPVIGEASRRSRAELLKIEPITAATNPKTSPSRAAHSRTAGMDASHKPTRAAGPGGSTTTSSARGTNEPGTDSSARTVPAYSAINAVAVRGASVADGA